MLQHKLSNPWPAKHGEHPAIRRHYCTRPANLPYQLVPMHFGELGKSSHSDKSTIRLRTRAAIRTGAPTRARAPTRQDRQLAKGRQQKIGSRKILIAEISTRSASQSSIPAYLPATLCHTLRRQHTSTMVSSEYAHSINDQDRHGLSTRLQLPRHLESVIMHTRTHLIAEGTRAACLSCKLEEASEQSESKSQLGVILGRE